VHPLGAQGAVPLAVLERDGFPESVHLGAAVVLDAEGRRLAAHGDVDALVYPRSALKPFQTVAALEAGARLSPEQQVVVTASHSGTPRHVELVRSVLAGAGLSEDALRTPPAWPMDEVARFALVRAGERPQRITMNCSGNHAGMLAGAVASGWPVEDYLALDHPIHALAAEIIARTAGVKPTDRGRDGCGGPVWAVPLAALARGYQRVVGEHPGLAEAVRAHPDLIEGPGTPTTRAVEALGVVAKAGAEGVWVAVAANGTAVAVKTLDGANRVPSAVAVALLAAHDAVDRDAADAFLADPALAVTAGGQPAGGLRVTVGTGVATTGTTEEREQAWH
jgi:L-asparaginase II